MANIITPYAGASLTTLTDALLAPGSGILIQNPTLISAPGSVNFYDGGLQGIGAGLLLTSGYTPGTLNNSTSFGGDNGLAGSAALDAVVNTVFQTQSFNATELTFSFTVTDPAATSVSFDLVFGSEEYPEWVDAFVDVAVVLVNGVNVALFNHNPNNPLSVISPNLAAGYFVDNANAALPTQYDGVSALLKFVAPIHAGVNTLTIAIADTGDGILDSGIFVANLSAGTTPGSGVVSAPGTGTSGNDTLSGTVKAEYFDLQAGDDTVYAGAGDDIVEAGAGNDVVYGGSGADTIKGDAGDDLIDGGADIDTADYAGSKADYDISFDAVGASYTVLAKAAGSSPSDGKDTLTGVELATFGDGSTWSLGLTGVVSQTDAGGPVVPNGNQPGTLFLSGIGGQGQTLTAKVSDVDGLPATGISYAWQADGADLGVSGNTFTVAAAQVGHAITVTAAYTDLSGHAESLVSAAKAIAAPGNGDFAITLLNLKAPIGASVMNPLTTLVQNAIELGVSPNVAGLVIKAALGLDPALDLQHNDSWAALQLNPDDAAALAVEKTLVQVAVMTSLGSDETGMALTQAILLANSNNTILDLANTDVIATLLGLDPSDPLVHEIWDRNDTIGSAQATGTATAVDAINAIWLDLQSGLSLTLSDTIGTLSLHINQAPVGSANATLASGTEGEAYVLSASELLAGFSDPEGGLLVVANLTADHGSVTASADNFIITPDSAYSGPMELSYSVLDAQGLGAPATQLFVVTPAVVTPPPVNQAPALNGTPALLPNGSEDTPYTVWASDLLAGFSDADGDTLSVSQLVASDATVADNADGSFTLTPSSNYAGPVTLGYQVSDGSASLAAGQSLQLVAVNDAPVAMADTASTMALTPVLIAVLANDSDVDNASLSVKAGSVLVDPLQGSAQTVGNQIEFTSAPGFSGIATLSYIATDGLADSVAVSVSITVSPLPVTPPTPGVILGTPGKDTLIGTDGDDWLDGGLGADTMSGGLGDDSYVVDNKGDRVRDFAGQGTDVVWSGVDFELSGFTENLTLTGTRNLHGHGNDQANVLTGNAGRNELEGGKGNDTLIGGGGKDQLAGGAGADIFKFLSLEDSVVGAKRDVIEDFKVGTDRIDLSLIDAVAGTLANESFDFIATGFTHVAGQLRFDTAHHILSGDVNGDGLADFEISLAGVNPLDVSSLIL